MSGQILTKNGLMLGDISFNKKITAIKKRTSKKLSSLPYIIPGFIDLHLHGGGGADVMQATNAIETIARVHAQHGTTSFLATTMTAPQKEIVQALEAIKAHPSSSAKVLGIHLEGPYISEKKLGAQSKAMRAIAIEEIKVLHKIFPLKVITLASELLRDTSIIKELNDMNIVVQLGHSDANYEEGRKALQAGAKSFTHLFNAMSSFHHRAPGLVGTALAHAQYAEIIPDLLHVHSGAIMAAMRAIPKLYFVSDATAATAMDDGAFQLGDQLVHKCAGGVRLADGTLAGSCITMSDAFRSALSLGLSISEASARCSLFPAELIGEKLRGQLAVKQYADFVVLEFSNKAKTDFKILEVYVEGKKI